MKTAKVLTFEAWFIGLDSQKWGQKEYEEWDNYWSGKKFKFWRYLEGSCGGLVSLRRGVMTLSPKRNRYLSFYETVIRINGTEEFPDVEEVKKALHEASIHFGCKVGFSDVVISEIKIPEVLEEVEELKVGV